METVDGHTIRVRTAASSPASGICGGIHLENPVCDCALLSRVQLAGEGDRQTVPRSLFYRCAVGQCRFFAYVVDEQDQIIIFRGPIPRPDEMASMGL
jgi:hypothetical protein